METVLQSGGTLQHLRVQPINMNIAGLTLHETLLSETRVINTGVAHLRGYAGHWLPQRMAGQSGRPGC